ncbi:MAG TPA: RpiB/LacA/LacB family sugar-phosphate isomerase [Lachnospiraceae bacterium]
MKIAIGCDPNALEAKKKLIKFLSEKGYGEIYDFGSDNPIYADVAIKVAEAVVKKDYDCGFLICGTGIGMEIAANKVKGAYAALLADVYSAKRARLSNNANIACMGAFTLGDKVREELALTFLENKFQEGCSSQSKIDAFIAYDNNR